MDNLHYSYKHKSVLAAIIILENIQLKFKFLEYHIIIYSEP